MPEILKWNKGVEEGLIDLLKSLLQNGKVRGVFTLAKIDENGGVAYLLISDPGELENAIPFYPLMPANAGKILSRITLKGAADSPVAVVMRPCELRAFIELVKRSQGSLENFILISYTCGGVYHLKRLSVTISKRLSPITWRR